MSLRNVSGNWSLHQSNGPTVTFTINPHGLAGSSALIDGVAKYSDDSGIAKGSVTDGSFVYTVSWSKGPKGEYSGNFNNDGRLTGITFDLHNPGNQATWFSNKVFS